MITYLSEDIKLPKIEKRKTSKWIQQVALQYGKKINEISFIFCSDNYILQVNKEYLKHDYYTDIITFDYSENDKLSGDIFISVDTVKTNAEKFNQTFEVELHRVIIHGILHLCGQKDKAKEDRAEMTRKENLALNFLDLLNKK
jgi:rRNA maturation RNase YbeY